MKYILSAILVISLAGCQTPEGITSTAGIVNKMTIQLNGNLADYVSAANTERTRDEERLVADQQLLTRTVTANADQFRILELVGDDKARTLLTALRAPVEPFTVTSPDAVTQRSMQNFAQQLGKKNTFDTGPLTQVATTTGTLAKPLDKIDQLKAFYSFSKQVNDDLNTLNQSTSAKATPTVTTPKP